MKLRNYYIEKFRKQRKELALKNELWRLRFDTEEQFMYELDSIFVDSLIGDFNDELQRENYIREKCSQLLVFIKADKETENYIRKRKEETIQADLEAIPLVRDQLKTIKSPLEWENIVRISKWIWRKQIKFNDLDHQIQIEFKNTFHYERLKRENKLNRKTIDE